MRANAGDRDPPEKTALIVSLNFFPERIGIGKFNHEFAERLAAKGYAVEVIVPNPHYPHYKIFDGYRNWFRTERCGSARVHRVPAFILNARWNSIKRLFLESTFLVTGGIAFFWLLLRRKKFNFVFYTSPPLFICYLTALTCKVFGMKSCYHVQDLQTEILLNNQRIPRFLKTLVEKIEAIVFNNSTYVSTITETMAEKIKKRSTVDVLYFPNWVDRSFESIQQPMDFRKKFGLGANDFVCLYSGSLGKKQGIEMLLDAAASLKEQGIKFIVTSEGREFGLFKQAAERQCLDNIYFQDFVDKTHLFALFDAANLHLILQRKEFSDVVFPSKLLNIYLGGGLVLATAAVGSSLGNEIAKAESGFCIEPGSARLLADEILRIRQNFGSFQSMRQIGSRYVKAHYDMDRVIERYLVDIGESDRVL